jgi:hypothetical protein
MDCEQARGLIIEFLYDELPSESVSELQEHLAECEDCLKYKEEVQGTLECLNRVEDLRAPVDLAVLHDAIDSKRHRVTRFLRRRWPVWATISVCGIMLFIFTLFVSEIRYEDNALTFTFNGQKGDSLSEKTERVLAAYREDQLRFQTQLSDELRASVTALSQIIDRYESQRDKRIAGAFQQMQIQQHQVLLAIQKELESLASQTEDEFKRSYLTMAALADLQ